MPPMITVEMRGRFRGDLPLPISVLQRIAFFTDCDGTLFGMAFRNSPACLAERIITMYFCITLEFGANGITSEVNEYQEYNRDTLEEANAFFDSAIADAARMGITGIRLESFSETITELRTWGTYA